MADPDLRIQQANQRTLLAWVRTGLALMAFGFVLARLVVWLRLEHPDRSSVVSAWLGIATLALGVTCHVIGALRFVAARRAILDGKPIHTTKRGPVAVALLVASIGAVAVVYLLTEL